MSTGDKFHFYAYLSDDTSTYAVKLADAVASSGGFTTQVNVRAVGPFPYGAKGLRHVYAQNPTTGARVKIPIQNPSFGPYTDGGTIPFRGVNYNVEGAFGERQRLNHVA
jgi:hypothetical protein